MWAPRTATTANVRPDDFLTITEASQLGKKDSLATYEVSSTDPSLVSVKLGKNNKIKISSGGNQKGKVDVTVTATSRLDGTTTEDSFDVIVGSSRRKRNGNKRQTIDLYIDGGSLNAPYYNIYDSEGVLIDDLLINPRNKYTFSRLDGATSHPVYISCTIKTPLCENLNYFLHFCLTFPKYSLQIYSLIFKKIHTFAK